MAEVLLSAQGLGKAYGAAPLFESLSFGIFEGDRIGLVGPNGSGKSTLLRLLAGAEEADTGTRSARKRLRVGYVTQDPAFESGQTVAEVLRAALVELDLDEAAVAGRVAIALGRGGFDRGEQPVDTLSGGWRKRLAIAREIVRGPELLLLDEPTNHLDVEGILWLEALLVTEPEAYVVVSHDRYFLEAVARRVLELSRVHAGGLLDVAGRYSQFLAVKEERLRAQASYEESLANRVRREAEWLSRKARARTRKAQARVDEAGRLADELDTLRSRTADASAGIGFQASGRRTRELLTVRDVAKGFPGRSVVTDLSLRLGPGTRLGLLGPNGSGKTTLLRVLSGEIAPDSGSVVSAANLQIVEFEQDRASLDPSVSLRRTLAPAGDSVVHQGRPVHVAGWAKRFLFRPEQLEQPVGRLSGGEQARVLLARLILQPADLLLLDEPTNDLDIPTLEVLEESLLEFPGALVLVTHDRYLMDRVCTQVLALDGQGGTRFFADLAQWEAERTRSGAAEARDAAAPSSARARSSAQPRRFSYKEKREWEQMEASILAAEADLAACEAAAADPSVATDAAALQARLAALEAARARVEQLYARWAELEGRLG